MRHRRDVPWLWRSPIAPGLWKLQTAGLELCKNVLAHTPDMVGVLDGHAPASLGVKGPRFIFPAPGGALAIEDNIECLIEIVKPETCALRGGLEGIGFKRDHWPSSREHWKIDGKNRGHNQALI